MLEKLNIVRFKSDSVLDVEPSAPLRLFLEGLNEKGATFSLVLEEAAINHLIDLVQQMMRHLPETMRSN